MGYLVSFSGFVSSKEGDQGLLSKRRFQTGMFAEESVLFSNSQVLLFLHSL